MAGYMLDDRGSIIKSKTSLDSTPTIQWVKMILSLSKGNHSRGRYKSMQIYLHVYMAACLVLFTF
jgi:hypothetical protein